MPTVDITLYQARNEKEPLNQQWDRLLDSKIDEICELIVSGKPFKAIAELLGVKPYYFFTWKKKTVHKEAVDSAIEASAHTLEQGARDILVEGILNGTQNMAEANLRRELSKALQFAAAKRNQSFYGTQKQEIKIDDSKPVLESKEEYQFILEQLKQKRAMGAGAPNVGQNPEPIKKNEPHIKKDDGYTEYEEVK